MGDARVQRLYTGLVECRADGRTLRGAVIRFGELSPSHRERIMGPPTRTMPTVPLNLRHDPMVCAAWAPGGGLRLIRRPDRLDLRADLSHDIPAARAALRGVSNGTYNGLSIEFVALRDERTPEGVRLVHDWVLHGVGLVPSPSYPGSAVDRRAGMLSATVATNRAMDCRCSARKTASAAIEVRFGPDAFADIPEGVIATTGRLSDAVATSANESLRLSRGAGGSLVIDLDPVDTAAGRELAALVAAGVPVFARPVWDPELSDWTLNGDVAEVRRAVYSLILVKPVQSDRTEGLPRLQAAEGRVREGSGAESPTEGLVRPSRGITLRKRGLGWL